MNRQFVDYTVSVIATGVTAYVKSSYFRNPGNEIIAYGIAIIAGLLVFVVLKNSITIIDKIFLIDPRYKYLGLWVEDMHKDKSHHYSLFEIKHDFLTNSFQVAGDTYDAVTHEPYAEWVSIAVAFPENKKLYYLHKSVIYNKKGDISGVTRLNFAGSGGRFYEGTGYVIDNSKPLKQIYFTFDRLEQSETKRLIGKRTLKSKNDRMELFKKLLEERSAIKRGEHPKND